MRVDAQGYKRQAPNHSLGSLLAGLGLPNCPANGQVGKPIDTLTLKALLAVPLRELSSPAYRFCAAPDCPLVYYGEGGQSGFDESMLRELVCQKHRDEESVLVCYCFGFTVGAIRAEIARAGRSTVVERATAGIRAGHCACEIRNPQGTCCLGNVRELVNRLSSEGAALGE